MKKALSLLMAAALSFSIFSGCQKEDKTQVRVGSLKGPTTIGLLNLMDQKKENYQFSMQAAADQLTASFIAGDVDIALVPANLASVLYNKTEGKANVIDINTLGVLYLVTGDESIKSFSDLEGKTVLMTGQGTVPEYSMQYILEKTGVKAELDFKSEATEIAALLQEDPTQISVLPQPFATATCLSNDKVKIAGSLGDEWEANSGDSKMITGVTVVRSDFLKEHEGLVKQFITDHKESAAKAISDLDKTADLCVSNDIIAKAPLAKKAIPECNIVCIDGEEMKKDLSGYLKVLSDFDAKSIGGKLPGDDFYYIAK